MPRTTVALLVTIGIALVAILLSRIVPTNTAQGKLEHEYRQFTSRKSQVEEGFAAIDRRIQYLEVQNHLLARIVHELAPVTMEGLGISHPAAAPALPTESDANEVQAFATMHGSFRNPTRGGEPYIRQIGHRYPMVPLDPNVAGKQWKLMRGLQAGLANEKEENR